MNDSGQGGYRIINFNDISLSSTSTRIADVYNELNKNYRKAILLSGLNINGTKINDVFVDVIKLNNQFVISIYNILVNNILTNYKVTVDSSDNVTLTIAQSNVKGDKGDPGTGATVVQTTGTSTDNVMSQKAVTDEIDELKENLADLTGNGEITFESGKLIQGGQIVSAAGYYLSNAFYVLPGNIVHCTTRLDSDIRQVAFFDENNAIIEVHNRTEATLITDKIYKFELTVPSGASYFRATVVGSTGLSTFELSRGNIVPVIEEMCTELDQNVDTLNTSMANVVTHTNTGSNLWQSGRWQNNSGSTISSNTRYISLTGYLQEDVSTIKLNDTSNYKYLLVAHDLSATNRGMGTYNTVTCNFERYVDNFINTAEFDLEEVRSLYPTYSFTISLRKTTETDINVNVYDKVDFVATSFYDRAYINTSVPMNRKIYVSTNGSDTNNGTATSPVATVNKALELGATHVLVSGGNYSQTVDLKKCKSPFVSIKSIAPTSRVIFYAPDCLIAETETSVSGYTKVYVADTTHTFPQTTSKIFQNGVNDTTTRVVQTEIHALQRGAFYRSEDTKMHKCTATALNDALTEIENATEYKWFFDTSSSKIYFSRPQAITSTNPLMTGLYDTAFFTNLSRDIHVEMVGIEVKYARLNLMSAEITDCKVANACGGGIIYNNGVGIKLTRCEVLNAYSGTLGDGICATGSNQYGRNKGTTITMTDCWVHDNNDDGFSDHCGCESTLIGGLYEYNGKGGVLPTGGGSCTCYNVISRRNAIGFEIAGTSSSQSVASGRNGQQIDCFNCIAENNTNGVGYGFFIAGNKGMTMNLYNCISRGNTIGYYGSYNVADAIMNAFDCCTLGDGSAKANTVNVFTANPLS